MKFADMLRGLVRRWYIVVPGLVVTVAITLGAWFMIPPGHTRSATQLLLPGETSMPEGANPYLFLGGLSPAADVLVRALGSRNVMNEITEKYPSAEIEIARDTSTPGPIVVITVTAESDAVAGEVLEILVDRTATLLDDFQKAERISVDNRMTVVPVTVDSKSTLQQRTRVLATAGAGIIGLMATLLLAGFVDGVRHGRSDESSSDHP